MKVSLQDFALLRIGTYAITRPLCMAIRKETVLSSLMYVRETELYSVSYSLQRKVCLMVSSAILSSITSRCSGNEPRASPSSRGEPRELQKSRLASLSKFVYFEYVSGLYKFVVLTICSQEYCVIWSFFFRLMPVGNNDLCISFCCSPLQKLVFLKGPFSIFGTIKWSY